MRLALGLALAMAVAVAMCDVVLGGSGDKEQQDLAAVTGTWKMVSIQVDGESPPPEAVKTMRLVLSGNQWTMNMDGKKVASGTLSIDPAKHTIDRVDLDGEDKGKEFHGIVEVNGDTMKACWSPAGKDRPTDYSSEKGSKRELNVLERVKQ